MKYTHNCIKCSTSYTDNDPDPYYCSSCNEQRKAIAQRVDAKLATKISKRKTISDLQAYDAAQKVHGFLRVSLN